ncbi:MAG: hypothetical protein HN348_10095 [Proteobacteria bacterium]|jgi:hypothetical protein|nr:hypothetical protein [Pseudomonadota bacterium]
MRFLLLTLILVGCPRSGALNNHIDYESTPRLPSPSSGTYAQVPSTPTDHVVASVVGLRQWDASLSGAAAAIALSAVEGSGGLARWELREALWRAGYPYPIAEARGWSVPQKSPPPEALSVWLNASVEGDDIGLVRARASGGDAWVGIRAHPRVSVGTMPRYVDSGGTVVLPALPEVTYEVSDGKGKLLEGSLDTQQTFTLTIPGEWMFRLFDGQGTVAEFPLYCGIEPPTQALLEMPDMPVDTTKAAEERVRELLKKVRVDYGLAPFEDDTMLTSAVRSSIKEERDLGPLVEGLGFSLTKIWRCEGSTVEDCLDQLIWQPVNREVLLSTDYERFGVGGVLASSQLQLVIVVAGDEE